MSKKKYYLYIPYEMLDPKIEEEHRGFLLMVHDCGLSLTIGDTLWTFQKQVTLDEFAKEHARDSVSA